MRRMLGAIGICMALACSNSADRTLAATGNANLQASSPDAFAGTWRSVTPSFEFVGLTVSPLSSQQGVLGARLTFSGVYWEGTGRISGDSLSLNMTHASGQASTVMVVRATGEKTVRLQTRAGSAPSLDLSFVRED